MTSLEALKLVHAVQRGLLVIQQSLDIAELKEPNMPISTNVATLISEFDAATNAIAARIQKLVSASPSLSADEQAAFAAEVAKLQVLGADPANPVPPAA